MRNRTCDTGVSPVRAIWARAGRPCHKHMIRGGFGLGLLIFLLVGSLSLAQIRRDDLMPSSGPTAVRFANVDILVDPHGSALAAYQLEFLADSKLVTLVGIEGGEHTAFSKPPYYDPRALGGGRVILAALNTGANLPNGKTRVARLHLQIRGQGNPAMSAKLVVAASSNDRAIDADVTVSQGAMQ